MARRSPYFVAKDTANSKETAKKKKNSPEANSDTKSKTPKTSRKKRSPSTRDKDDNKDTKEDLGSGGGVTSPFFLRSPSSVFGSVVSLGPLIGTWAATPGITTTCNPTTEYSLRYCSRIDTDSDAICDTCQPIVDYAMEHFVDCPKFDENAALQLDLATSTDTNTTCDSSNLSCVELVGKQMESQVRHLCPHLCYLKAFSPCRDWWYLRQALSERTDMPTNKQCINSLLKDYTCHLVKPPPPKEEEEKEDVSSEEEESEESDDEPPSPTTKPEVVLPKTLYYNLFDGSRYHSIPQVVKALGGSPRKKVTFASSESSPDKIGSTTGAITTPVPSCSSETLTDTTIKLDYTASASASASTSTSARINMQPPVTVSSIQSPLGLLEELLVDNPWRLLLSTIFLNRTRRQQVDRIFVALLQRWPTPQIVIQMDGNHEQIQQLANLLTPLGLHNKRATGIVRFSKEYLALVQSKSIQQQQESNDTTTSTTTTTTTRPPEFQLTRKEVKSLFNCGQYSADAYQIFVQRDWNNVRPTDHALKGFVEWKQSLELGGGMPIRKRVRRRKYD